MRHFLEVALTSRGKERQNQLGPMLVDLKRIPKQGAAANDTPLSVFVRVYVCCATGSSLDSEIGSRFSFHFPRDLSSTSS